MAAGLHLSTHLLYLLPQKVCCSISLKDLQRLHLLSPLEEDGVPGLELNYGSADNPQTIWLELPQVSVKGPGHLSLSSEGRGDGGGEICPEPSLPHRPRSCSTPLSSCWRAACPHSGQASSEESGDKTSLGSLTWSLLPGPALKCPAEQPQVEAVAQGL